MLLHWSLSGCFWISSSSLLNAWNVTFSHEASSNWCVHYGLYPKTQTCCQILITGCVTEVCGSVCVCVQPCSASRSCLISLRGKTKFPSGAIVATAGITVGMTTGIPRCCCQRAHLVSKCQKNWCRSGTLHLSLHLSARKWVDIFLSVRLLLSFVFFCSNSLLLIITWQMGAFWGCWV